MPKAAKPRSTTARHSPLSTRDTNASKKRKPASAKKAKEVEDVEDRPIPPTESYLLLIRLINSNDPIITRLLSVPSNYTFAKLHDVLQVAFGWANSHAHSFEVFKLPEPGEPPGFMTGRGESLLLLQYDDDFADAFPEPEKVKKEADYTLADLYGSEQYGGKVGVAYEYDHGDSWDHEIAFLGRANPSMRKAMHIPDDMQVVCLNGEGHPCAEDCGSSPGWEDLKALFTEKRKDPEGIKAWYKESCLNGNPKGLDPYKWDILVNDALAKIKG